MLVLSRADVNLREKEAAGLSCCTSRMKLRPSLFDRSVCLPEHRVTWVCCVGEIRYGEGETLSIYIKKAPTHALFFFSFSYVKGNRPELRHGVL